MDRTVERSLNVIADHITSISASLDYNDNLIIDERLYETNKALWAINQTLKQLVSVTESSLKSHSDS